MERGDLSSRAAAGRWRGLPGAGRGSEFAQVVEAARARVAMWGTEADRFVVAMKPGNAGRVKGADHPGLFGGQPRVRGRSR